MRLVLVLLALSVFQTIASTGYSQNKKITLINEEISLEDVLRRIEDQSEFRFIYDKSQIDLNKKVNVNFNSASVEEVLNEIFVSKGVDYQMKDNQVILKSSGSVMMQQKLSVTGKVSDTSGQPLPGVTVVVKGTTNGTITNFDGVYTLSDVSSNGVIQFSFVGMKTQEIPIIGKEEIDVVMEEDAIGIEEVVAIGYGTVKKSDLTGAVGAVEGKVIENRQATQISQALQGAVSGVMVTRNNNAPGATSTIRIRGITTIGENDPLVIVDGVPVGSINDVNPSDVESVSVLKDAASASIYGSRAAAGVILVTTKRANTGELALSYNAEFGIEKATEMSDYAGAQRYMEMVNELRWNDNDNIQGSEYSVYSAELIENYLSLHEENPDVYPNTNWVDLILQKNAPRQSHIISVSGGTKSVRTKASLAYDKIDGLYLGRDYKRLTARFNNDISINKNLSSTLDFYIKRSIYNDPSTNPMSLMRKFPAIYSAVWSNGLISEGKTGQNVYAQLKYGGYDDRWYNQVGGKASITFTPIDGLNLSAIVSPILNSNKSKEVRNRVEYTDYDNPNDYVGVIDGATINSLNEFRSDSYNITSQVLINYIKAIGSHNLNLMSGFESYQSFYENLSAGSSSLEFTTFPYLDLANNNFLNVGGDAYKVAYNSYFGRVMYNYRNKYYMQANLRYDGSSRFASEYRWGAFPSLSAGWVVSEESFLKGFDKLSFLKLRFSWGRLGNERIGNYPYQSKVEFNNALFYEGNTIVSAQTAAQKEYAIRNISWETTESIDIGADIYLFNSKLQISGDYYQKTTSDMLLELEIPDYIGFTNPEQNTGKMDTKGWEFDLRWNDRIGDLYYSISANISDFKSIMGDLGGIEFIGNQVKVKGSEFNEWYGYKTDGLFQTQDDVDNSPKLNSNVSVGDVKLLDISGPGGVPDGIVSADYDRTLLGGSLPRYLYGSNVNLEYKNFDFNLTLQGVGKQNVRKTTTMVQPLQSTYGNFPSIIDGDYWSVYNSDEKNLSVKYPRLTSSNASNNYAMSDYWMFNGGYLRIKNVTLGYNLPHNLIQKFSMTDVRLYASVIDLISLNKYPKGWDPEISDTGYPITASFIFGVSVKF